MNISIASIFSFFFGFTALARTSSSILNESGKMGHPWEIFFFLTIKSIVNSKMFTDVAYQVEEILYIPSLLKIFIRNECWFSSNDFPDDQIYLFPIFIYLYYSYLLGEKKKGYSLRIIFWQASICCSCLQKLHIIRSVVIYQSCWPQHVVSLSFYDKRFLQHTSRKPIQPLSHLLQAT